MGRPNSKLTGKVALVTGAAMGLGRAQALRLADEGASVVVTDIESAKGESVAAEIRNVGGIASFVALNVVEPAQWSAAVEVATAEFGGVDVLVNNAGVAPFCPAEETGEDLWDQTYAINATGQFLGCQAVIPSMKNRGGGSIVNVCSGLAIRTMPLTSAYAASKGAVRMLTKAAAVDLASHGIRVNAIFPGIARTELTNPLLSDPDFVANVVAPVPLGRPGEPDEIATTVVFLASADSSFMTGAELVVDGGTVAATMRTEPSTSTASMS